MKQSKIAKNRVSRRDFVTTSVKGAVGATVLASFPTIVPARVLGKQAPSNLINVGIIGIGRMGAFSETNGVLNYPQAKAVASCDVDRKRLNDSKRGIDGHYSKKYGKTYTGTKAYEDYRELMLNKDIDAVTISTPDHWHAIIAAAAVRSGKDVYMQKPASLTIAEGRALSNEVSKFGRILQIGSQQRSSPQFKRACELVRNGRIGEVHTVYVGLPVDNPKESGPQEEMPVPSNLNYEMWLGSTPYVKYTEDRVHAQKGVLAARPGWLRCEQFGAGMITGWGSHHFDIVNWGLGTEYTGPVEISCEEVVWPPKEALWDVHGAFKTTTIFGSGVKVLASNDYPNGIKFVGSKGWIFVTRGDYKVTATDPDTGPKTGKALDASDPKILTSEIGEDEIRLVESTNHHSNWLDSVISRVPPVAPIEPGHRACSICLLSQIAMKLRRKLKWDPVIERFKDDDEANRMLSRAQRWPWQMDVEYDLKTTL